MGVTLEVRGIKPADERFNQMLTIYRTCEDADVEIPEEVEEFFGGNDPDPDGVVIDLDPDKHDFIKGDAWEGWYTIDVTKLPKDIKLLKVLISY